VRIKDRPEYDFKVMPVTFPKTATVRDAITVMSDNNFGCVIVVDGDNKVEGMVTERDLMIRLLHQKRDPDATTLADIMTSEVRSAKEDDLVVDWLRIMSNERFRHLPVLDADGRVVKLMSQGDFVSYTWPDLLDQVKAKTKESLGAGYQIVLIVAAFLLYSIIMAFAV